MPRLSIRGKRFFSECRIFQPPRCPFPRPANPKKARRNADRISSPAGRSGGKRRKGRKEEGDRPEQPGRRPGPRKGRKGSGGNDSPRAPSFLSASCQRSGERGRGEEPAPTSASRRNSLPPSSAAGVVQAPCPYSVSGADGLSRHGVFLNTSRVSTLGGPRALSSARADACK